MTSRSTIKSQLWLLQIKKFYIRLPSGKFRVTCERMTIKAFKTLSKVKKKSFHWKSFCSRRNVGKLRGWELDRAFKADLKPQMCEKVSFCVLLCFPFNTYPTRGVNRWRVSVMEYGSRLFYIRCLRRGVNSISIPIATTSTLRIK